MARQTREFEPQFEGVEVFSVKESTTVAPMQPENPRLGIGRPIAFHSRTAPPTPPDRLYPGQLDSARRGIGRPIAYQPPKVHEKDKSKPLDILIGEGRRYDVGYSERNSHEPFLISKECTRVQRSEPHFHDVDGAC